MYLEDRSVYFDDDDWAEDAVLDGVPVRVIYGAPGDTGLGGPGMSTDRPRALIQAESVTPEPASGDDRVLEFACVTAARATQRWRVRQVLPDGTGMATLILVAHESQA